MQEYLVKKATLKALGSVSLAKQAAAAALHASHSKQCGYSGALTTAWLQ